MKRMKKVIVSIIVLTSLLFVMVGLVQAEYTPLPDVRGPEEVDFDGETVTLMGWYPSPADRNWQARVEEAEKLFNVTIEQRGRSGYNWIMSRILAGDSARDIYKLTAHDIGYFSLVADEMLYRICSISWGK